MDYEREQPTSSISQELFDIDLDGIPGNERVVIERLTDVTDTTYTTLMIQRFCPAIKNWRTEYLWTVEGLVHTEIENEFWYVLNAPVVILKVSQGSGSFLDYRVIGYHFGTLQELLSREAIFQGSVFIDAYNIIEQTGNQYSIWVVRQGVLNLVSYRVPIIQNAYVFEYSITDDEKVLADSTKLTLPVGGILQFIREDFNMVTERMLYSTEDDDAVRVIQNRSAYQFRKPMQVTFTIIPGGYNWENAVEINVEIR